LGIGRLNVPNAIGAKLNALALPWLLGLATAGGVRIVEAVEAISSAPHARYVGVRLEPK
jgi:hypothetical protein